MDNILKYLEKTAERFPDKTAVDDGTVQFTYQELLDKARHFGLSFLDKTMPGRPVAILREKSSEVLAAMFGIVYAGCFYVMIDPEQPLERLKDILSVLKTDLVLTDSTYKNQLEDAGYQGEIYLLDQERTEASLTEQDVEKLMERRSTADSTDLLYGIFTSGSTGKPKCVAVSQQAVIDFIGHFTKQFEITDQDRIANQAPFDFDVSVKDIYSAITTGATLVLVPKRLFSLPPRLLDYLCDKKVTVMVWAVSALCLISSLKGLKYKIPEDARIIMFSGEVMPVKQMRLWQQALPQTKFINLYGPSEITCNCTWYPVEREFQDGEVIPAGRAFDGRTVFLLDETGADITESGKTGEICVAGESLADGYYHNEEETARRFVTEQFRAKQETQDFTVQVILGILARMRIFILPDEKISRSSIWVTGSNLRKSKEHLRSLTEFQDAAVCSIQNAISSWDFIPVTWMRRKFIRNLSVSFRSI